MKKVLVLIVFVPTLIFCQVDNSVIDETKKQKKKEIFINDLIAKMTLMEKIGQMNQYSNFYDFTGPYPKNFVDSLKFEQLKQGLVGSVLNVSGVKKVKKMQKLVIDNSRMKIPLLFALDVIHGFQTINPIPLAESASWNLELIQKSASIAAKEAASAGINWTFAPMVDITRDPRWGRIMEGSGEDPYLGSKVAVARINGFQGNNLEDPLTIAACAKHFAAYGFAESGRDYNTVDVGLKTLHNVVLPPFKAAAEAGVATFMNSFNELNGIPATGNSFLQKEILKGDWGFKGFVVSDWGSIGEMIAHGYSKDLKSAAKSAITAGSDMDMMSSAYILNLKSLVDEKQIKINLIDNAVKRILSLKYDLGLFKDPFMYCSKNREYKNVLNPQNRQTLLNIAKESIVLLKNEENILPLAKTGLKIALIGDLADDKDSPLGNWRANGSKNSAISVLEAMKKQNKNALVYESGPSLINKSTYSHGELDINYSDTSGTNKALRLASKSDVVVVVMGEHGLQSGEGRSRAKINLPGIQESLLKKIYKANNKIVLVLMNGRPLDLSWEDENIPAIVEAWQLGTMSGEAISSVIFGDYNPSGKLPVSFPRSLGQVPIYYNHKNTGRPGPSDDVFWSHFNDEKNDPLYPFGYGLSYTKFNYANLKIENLEDESSIKVNIMVENIGKRSGQEVVQLYIRDLFSSSTRPVKELKRFKKLFFEKGERKDITFNLNYEDLGFLNDDGKLFFEDGKYEIMVGGSSLTSSSQVIEISFSKQ